MAFPVSLRKQSFVSCPRAYAAGSVQGQVLAVTVSSTASYFALAAGISQAASNRSTGDDPKSPTRNYLTIECDVDLGIIFGSTAALVTGNNVPALATVGTLTSGVYTPAAKTCFEVYAKQPIRLLLQDGVDLYLGFVASGAGTMRLYQSSNDNA